MRVILHYSEEIPTSFREDFFVRVAEETLKRCRIGTVADADIVTLSVVAVSPQRIQELNRTYRQKDAVTDILSFGEYADTEILMREARKDIFLGDIFFCYDEIVAGSAADHVTVARELTYVFSHGVLHLLGYDHSEAMFAIQDEVTDTCFHEV